MPHCPLPTAYCLLRAMKLVIFDCDGTLVDSQDAICGAMSLAFAGLGLAGPTRAQVLSVVGLSLPEAFQVLAPDHGDAVRHALAEHYKSAFPHKGLDGIARDPLFEGAGEGMAALFARTDIALGIATGKSRRGVARLFDQEGWHGRFVTIQTADSNPSKPHPGMIVAAMREAGIGPDSTVIVGDTTYDIEMGRNAGVATIGVGWGYHDVAALEAAGAQAIVTRFAALEATVDRLLAPRSQA